MYRYPLGALVSTTGTKSSLSRFEDRDLPQDAYIDIVESGPCAKRAVTRLPNETDFLPTIWATVLKGRSPCACALEPIVASLAYSVQPPLKLSPRQNENPYSNLHCNKECALSSFQYFAFEKAKTPYLYLT